MGLTRLTKKLMPHLSDIDGVIMVVNASDPQYQTLMLFYSAIEDISHFTVLNKCDMVDKVEVRRITTKLNREVIPACMKDGRGIPEIKYRLSQWEGRIAVLGVFNSGKTSLINTLTGEENKVDDIPGTTLEFTDHIYDGLILIDSVGQIIDVSKPLMVSIDLSDCNTNQSKLLRCLEEDSRGILESIDSSMLGLLKAVDVIAECIDNGGKLITCGAGASALVAMEIAGQAQETGLPVMCFNNNFATAQPISFAKGAFEDDRSIADYFSRAINKDDCVLGVSASGGTGFVFTTMEIAKSKGATTIAITENSDTPLGKSADIVIKSEAKPEGPSSSKVQTAHLAIGHALILTIADVRGIDATTAINYMLPDVVRNKKMGIK